MKRLSSAIARAGMLYALLVVAGGCGREKQADTEEPTPFDQVVAAARERREVRQRDSVALARSRQDSIRIRQSTGNPDHDFLRVMSDHHRDLILITHAAIESNNDPAIQPDIRKIEEEHDHELDTMLALLASQFNDRYTPGTSPEMQFTAELLRRPAEDYRFVFFQAAVKNELNAENILDSYLPRARNPEIRKFAEAMRRSEPSEIARLKRRVPPSGH